MDDERRTSLRELEAKLGYQFDDLGWLDKALTHKSYMHEVNHAPVGHSDKEGNEVLEFLGDSVLNLADYGRIRIMADQLGLESVDRQGPVVVFKFRDAGPASRQVRLADPVHLVRVLRARPDVMLTPPASVRLDLRKAGSAPQIKSWWTARARAGEVKPGFSKEEILRPAPEDPRAPGGVLHRVGDLLSTMLGEG
jgi:hypothetical protein